MSKLDDAIKEKKITFEIPMFVSLEKPNGFLCIKDRACHGCFSYAVRARQAYETHYQGFAVAYEGDLDTQVNFLQLFKSIALWYGVQPEEMTRHWQCVDMQFVALALPQLPDEERFKFNKTPSIKSH